MLVGVFFKKQLPRSESGMCPAKTRVSNHQVGLFSRNRLKTPKTFYNNVHITWVYAREIKFLKCLSNGTMKSDSKKNGIFSKQTILLALLSKTNTEEYINSSGIFSERSCFRHLTKAGH